MGQSRILLVDNGSLEPGATLALRALAAEVSRLVGRPVHPVSAMHSAKVDPALLEGKPAVIFEEAVRRAAADGVDELIVLPLFIGPSRAVTEFLPQVFRDNAPGRMKLSVRPTLFGEDGAELQGMLVENLKSTGWKPDTGTVLLCDHGSPIPEVTACRDKLADGLRAELGLSAEELIACSMERREGPEYAFNDPLLGSAMKNTSGDAVVLMLFLLPGRHAGPDGDVATIAKRHAPAGVRWKLSPLLGTHPDLPSLLAWRYEAALPSPKPALWLCYAFVGGLIVLTTLLSRFAAGFLPESIRQNRVLSLLFACLVTLVVLVPAFSWAVRRTRPNEA